MPFSASAAGPYIGGQLIAQGLNNAGNNLSEGIMKAVAGYQKTQEEQGADQVIINYAQQQGLVTPEIMEQYAKGSHSAKTGIVAGLVRQFAMTQQQKQTDSLEENRRSMQAEREQRAEALKTANENALLASAPPSDEDRWKAQSAGYDYLFNPKTQTHDLVPMQGDSGGTGRASDKTPVDVPDPTSPTGFRTLMMTGGQALKVLGPVDVKKKYGVNEAEFRDSTKTQRGVVDETGTFKPDPTGDQIRFNIHKDKTSGLEVDGGVIPMNEWDINRKRIDAQNAAHKPSSTETANPTATPPRGAVKAGGRVKVIDPQGKPWTIPAEQLDDALKQGFKQG